MVRDVGLAEELAQDALVAALEQWPATGVPDNPGAWLMATAKRRAIDQLRRDTLLRAQARRARPRARDEQDAGDAPSIDAALDDDIGDDLLRLIFIACHPVLVARGARRAHPAPGRRPDDRRDRARLPGARSRPSPSASCAPSAPWPTRTCRSRSRAATSSPTRLASVLEVDLPRSSTKATRPPPATTGCGPALCEEALRLGPHPGRAVPDEPEVHGLLALMEIQASRCAARDRRRAASRSCCSSRTAARWDQLADPPRPRRAGRAPRRSAGARGPYALQAAHRRLPRPRAHGRPTPTGRASPRSTARCRSVAPSPWSSSIARSPSAWPSGPAPGLALVDALADEPVAGGLSPAARACAATCWRSSDASTRRARNSSAPPP